MRILQCEDLISGRLCTLCAFQPRSVKSAGNALEICTTFSTNVISIPQPCKVDQRCHPHISLLEQNRLTDRITAIDRGKLPDLVPIQTRPALAHLAGDLRQTCYPRCPSLGERHFDVSVVRSLEEERVAVIFWTLPTMRTVWPVYAPSMEELTRGVGLSIVALFSV